MRSELQFDPAEIARVAAAVDRPSDSDRTWLDLRSSVTQELKLWRELRKRSIEQRYADLIEAISVNMDTGNGTVFKPFPPDLEWIFAMLPRPDKAGAGRPKSPTVNGDRLRTLREEAGMTQEDLADAVSARTGGFDVRSLRRYEDSEPAKLSNLRVIVEVLSERLKRAVTIEEITLY
jgi:hypothetical protein